MHYRTQHNGFQMKGYQADMGVNWWGGIYEEHGRNQLLKGDEKSLLAQENGFDHHGWHSYKIVCKGDSHQLFIDGILTADYTEQDVTVPKKGVFGIQLHGAGHSQIEMKNVLLKKL